MGTTRTVRVFGAARSSGYWLFEGEMEIARADPYRMVSSSKPTGEGPVRDVAIFRLLRRDGGSRQRDEQLSIVERTETKVSSVDVFDTERRLAHPHIETVQKERWVQELVERYAERVRAENGSEPVRFMYRAGLASLLCVALNVDDNFLMGTKP